MIKKCTIVVFLLFYVISINTVFAQSCGGSLAFNNNSDAVQLPLNNQIHSSNGFTWECWFKLNTPFASNPRALINSIDPVAYEDIYLGFGWNYGAGNVPVNHLGFKVDGPNATTGPANVSCDYIPPGGFLLGTWYHTAGVMDYITHTSKLYLNGVLVDTQIENADTFSRTIQSQLSYDPDLALGGNMDEVRIWKRARTDSDIFADYNHCLSGNEIDLLSYYRCNQSTGTILTDATSNGNNGAFINSTIWSVQQPTLTGSVCSSQGNFSISITSTCIANNNATAFAAITTTITSPIISYSWTNSSGTIISQTTNTPSLTNTISNLTNGVYTLISQINAPCGPMSTQTITINCTPTPLCSGTLGAPVFFEDFGSGTSLYGPALPPGVTNYPYLQGIPNNGTYVIASSSNPSGTNAGYVNDNNDHTGNANGYMMVVNSDYPASEVYRKHVTGLCQNTTYVFSAYLANNNSPDAVTNVCASNYVYANIKFQTEFPAGTVLNSITSGNLAVATNSLNLPWIQYGFAFTTGPGQTSVDVVLKNNAPGGCGNDYVVDDISLAPCGPGVALAISPNDTLVCLGDAINLQSTITSGGYTNPQYQWQYSNNGGATWTNILGATSPNYNISSLAASQVGSYQLIVAENGNINFPSCSIIAGPLTFSLGANCTNTIALFSSPDTVCVNQSFSVSNLSVGANSNYWTFCQGNTATPPQAINLGNVGFFNGPVFITIAKEGSDYYAFVTNNSSSMLTKLFFGSSLLNVPVATNLGNVSGAFPGSLEDIHIEYESGNWYGIAVGGFSGGESIIRIDFGNSLANTPTAVNYGNIGGLDYPQRLKIFKNGANYYGFTTNRNNNTFTRFSFGTSIANTPTGVNLGNIGALNTPDAIAIVNVASTWYGYIINEGNNTITRLDFGNSLLNIPTGTNLGNTGALNGPRGIDMWTECNEVRGLITNRFSDDLLNMNLSAGPTGPVVTTSFGNIANFSFPHSITRFRSGDTLFAFITNVSNNTLSRIYYPGCVNSSIASSTLVNPSAISYNTPGNYYINIVINEGQISQTNYCKQVTVIATPTVIVSNANICAGSSASITASGANSYSWTSSPSLSSTTGSLVTTTPNISESYTVTGFIGSCTNTAVSSVTIIPSPSITITPSLSLICVGQTTTLTASGANTYIWNSSPTLSSNLGSVVVANPISTTIYTVTGTLNTCTNTAVTTVSVLSNPTLTLSPNVNICQGVSSSVTLTASGATTYTWVNSATLSSSTGSIVIASPNTTTNYTVTGVNSMCSNTAVITVSVNPSPTITATFINNTFCGLTNGSATIMSLPSNNTYSWSSGVLSSTNTASNLASGNYTITVLNATCQTNTVISVLSSVPLIIVSSTVIPSNCVLNDGSISVIDNLVSSNYSWSPNVSSTNVATNLATGNYALTILNGACATSTVFNVGSTGNSSTSISTDVPNCESNDGVFTIDSITGGTPPYLTSFNNTGYTSNMVFENLSTGTYTLIVRDSNMCETGFILVMPENNKDYTLYVPNTFTPNNDKINDVWYVQGTCLGEFSCLIYNRWGEKIRELKDIKDGWDGTYRGASVPDGVYVYLIEVETKSGTINKAGHITVFR